jgi:hypothetical protein
MSVAGGELGGSFFVLFCVGLMCAVGVKSFGLCVDGYLIHVQVCCSSELVQCLVVACFGLCL